ncbi:GTP cyclohydrolase II RibA [Enterovirga aerilata]|uniref:GTP cyclohydrolase-2 n=1 Tax=Enterovirga aerilata TaxID=2730920 RepID=A0A849I3N0_9HYPH|nr:GTP cyclohydrolase II RibA [Enterovirga sp. DB1703]NNM70985.1 GTP cyclohydrolase II RibA [Enterovirga sp. DB1703]
MNGATPNTPSLSGDLDRTSVERAIAELRMGRPVLLESGEERALVQSAEDLGREQAERLDAVSVRQGRLVLPAARLKRLGLERPHDGWIGLPSLDVRRIATLAFSMDARLDGPVRPAGRFDQAALELARLALSLPAVVVMPLSEGFGIDGTVLRVSTGAVEGYRAARARDLKIVGRAPVPLEDAAETEFVVFRGGEGLRDQVAVIVGAPDLTQPVTVRLHSACLTGDLFGSLKCDCGDQLRFSVRWMAEHGGGILLYLDQEGRGNGIANKIRAYRLQAEGYDTYDADEMLGFGPDQRRFDFAAEMLRQLGVTRVNLITNNPDKIAALRNSGLELVSHQRAPARTTAENARYLASKRDRAGHLLGFAAAASGPPADG